MTEEIKYNKDEKWITYKQLAEMPQQTIARLEQENKELKEFCVELERAKQMQHMKWFARCTENHNEDSKIIEKYRSAFEEIKRYAEERCRQKVLDKINEVLNDK